MSSRFGSDLCLWTQKLKTYFDEIFFQKVGHSPEGQRLDFCGNPFIIFWGDPADKNRLNQKYNFVHCLVLVDVISKCSEIRPRAVRLWMSGPCAWWCWECWSNRGDEAIERSVDAPLYTDNTTHRPATNTSPTHGSQSQRYKPVTCHSCSQSQLTDQRQIPVLHTAANHSATNHSRVTAAANHSSLTSDKYQSYTEQPITTLQTSHVSQLQPITGHRPATNTSPKHDSQSQHYKPVMWLRCSQRQLYKACPCHSSSQSQSTSLLYPQPMTNLISYHITPKNF